MLVSTEHYINILVYIPTVKIRNYQIMNDVRPNTVISTYLIIFLD